MSSPRVFVVQRVRHIDHRTGELEDKHDLSPARRFGELIYLLDGMSGRATKASQNADVSSLCDLLYGAKPTIRDCLLPMGAPTLIGVATAIFAEATGGRVRLLQWDQRRSDYVLLDECVRCADPGCVGHR